VKNRRVFVDQDLDTSPLEGKQLGIIGYGSQGRAQALNLRDSGFTPLIGIRPGKSLAKVQSDRLEALGVGEVSERSDVLMVLVPDETQADLTRDEVFPKLRRGTFLGFATGFGVHFGLVKPPPGSKIFLTAPKGPGHILRKRFEEGGAIPALVASLHDEADELAVAMAYAKAIGCGRAGVLVSSFREEAVADLFGEQCVLSGGLVELMKAAFDVLVARGYAPEAAYIECILEVEYMAALISRVGFAALVDNVSSTAYFGGVTRGRRLVDGTTRQRLGVILDEIEQGRFVEEFKRYVESGKISLAADGDLSRLEAARSNLRNVSGE
jgi:ketol-acid reductoisomerase